MASVLPRAEVDRIARLARLELTEAECELFASQLAAILTHAQQLAQLDTTGVAATSHALARRSDLRADETVPSLERSEALTNAPEPAMAEGLFKVPRVIG